MKLDQLPVEVLIKIFSFLPAYGEVSLVNKLFYDIACHVNDPNICLRIDRRFYDRYISYNVTSPEWLDSMHTTNRKITKVHVDGIEEKYLGRQLEYSLKNIATTLTVLIFAASSIDLSTLLEILLSAANIEQLELYGLGVDGEIRAKPSLNERSTDTLSLNKLKSLSFVECGEPFDTIFNFLPAGILTELQITGTLIELESILSRQFNVQKLVFKCYGVHEEEYDNFSTDILNKVDHIFDQIELESLSLILVNVGNAETTTILQAILSKQTKLKSLTLYGDTDEGTLPNNQIMDAIANLLELEKLEIDVTEISLKSYAKIEKLKKLKELTLKCDGCSKAKIKTLSKWKNNSMRKLSLKMPIKMSVDRIGSLAKSVPHLTELSVSAPESSDQYPSKKKLDAILRRFNFVEVLSVDIWDEPLVNPSFNPKLRELSIVVSFADSFYKQFLTRLTADYPNLKKLKLTISNFDFDFEPSHLEIRTILNAFTKLESLVINVSYGCGLAVTHLDSLLVYKNNLKFLSLGRHQKLTEEVINKLRAHFRLIYVDKDALTMAVDRHTMNREFKKEYFALED